MLNIEKCLDLCQKHRINIRLITEHTHRNIKDSKKAHQLYVAQIDQYKKNTKWDKLRLPDKAIIENWTNQQIIISVMNKNTWTIREAQYWLTAFMKFLYTSMRLIHEGKSTNTIPFVSDCMDNIFHAYLELSFDFFEMCQEVFNLQYIAHCPGARLVYNDQQLAKYLQLVNEGTIALENDWGRDFIDRVFEYETDVVSILIDKKVNIYECIELCVAKKINYDLLSSNKGRIVKQSEHAAQQSHQHIEQLSHNFNLSRLELPNKIIIEHWEHHSVILKLMNEHTETSAYKNLVDDIINT